MKTNKTKTYIELQKNLIAGIFLFLCANSKIMPEMLGLSLGLYVAFIYCRCNIFVLSPFYIASALLTNFSITGLVYALAPVVVMCVAKFIHYKLLRPMRVLACNIYLLISVLIILSCYMYQDNWGIFLISLLANQIFGSFCIIACYAVLVRGLHQKFSVDEVASCFIVIAITSLGAYCINYNAFTPYYLFLGFVLIYTIYCFSLDKALLINLAIACGGAIADKSLAVMGGVMLICLVGYTFKQLHIWIAMIACILADLLCGIYFNCYQGYNYIHIAVFSCGAILFTILPKKIKNKFPTFSLVSEGIASKNFVSRIKQDISARIGHISSAFYQMADCFGVNSLNFPNANPKSSLASELTLQVCSKCPYYGNCTSSLGKPLYLIFEQIFKNLNTKITLVDLPTFVNSRCKQIPQILSHSNNIIFDYNAKLGSASQSKKQQVLLAYQFAGIANILTDLGEEIQSTTYVNENLKERIIQELGYQNIICEEAIIAYSQNKYDICLIVRKEDEDKKALVQVISRLVGVELVINDSKTCIENNKVCLFLCNKPSYDVAYASQNIPKTAGEPNGDSFSLEKISYNKVMVVLCDGMGNGKIANAQSQNTLSMITKFYKAGFDQKNSINLINKLLSFTNTESFTALDLCIIDLDTGVCDFIKMGGVDSLIKRDSKIQIIQAQALPIGIIEDARPQIQRHAIEVGDIVFLCTDGIMDSLTLEGLQIIINRIGTINPQQICNEVMQQARIRGLNDDASMIAFRIFQS